MLVKHNNNSISDITSAGQLAQGKMTLISSQTASGSASIEFTSGIDSTYPIYRFEFINLHLSSESKVGFQASTNGGSSYGITLTSTFFYSIHSENDTYTGLSYEGGSDLAQSTSDQIIHPSTDGIDNDENSCGEMYLFNPSSTTFVKHFMGKSNQNGSGGNNDFHNNYFAGYFNSTSALNAIIFRPASGNIDSGTIKLYGIKDS